MYGRMMGVGDPVPFAHSCVVAGKWILADSPLCGAPETRRTESGWKGVDSVPEVKLAKCTLACLKATTNH
jgi:hypothetical protein